MQIWLKNIFHLGIKELRGLSRDRMMLVLIIYVFSGAVYIAGSAMPETLHSVPVAVIDEDRSTLSHRIINSFQRPHFLPPVFTWIDVADAGMDAGDFTFALNIPPDFERDVLAEQNPAIQLNVDATRMSQAFVGAGHIQQMIYDEVTTFVARNQPAASSQIDMVLRNRFNPNLTQSWFGSLNEAINAITMLSIILTGAALIREREHGTVEHLLVMPITPAQIMISKVWSMGLVVLVAAALSIIFIVGGALRVRIEGSLPLYLLTIAIHLCATTAIGIYLATLARSMPQFGMLLILTLIPLEMLSGGVTPRESMPPLVQTALLAAPTTHFVAASQAVLFRGAGIDVIWPRLVMMLLIGTLFFTASLRRFRKTLSQM